MSALTTALHSALRWVVLAAGVLAIVRFTAGWFRGSAWSRLDDRLTLAFAVSLDVQWVVGLVLYLGVSVLGGTALASEGLGIVRSPELRFWALVHPLLATAALALAHAARIKLRSVTAATARHRVAALSFGGAVALLVAAVR